MANTWGFLAGRIIFGAYLLYSGLNHFTRVDALAGYAASKGVPAPRLAVLASGLLLLFAGVSFLLGLLPKLGVLAVVLFLVPTTFMMHAFWDAPAAARMAETVNFTKNLALAGASLMFLAIPEPWPVSVGARSRARRLRHAPA